MDADSLTDKVSPSLDEARETMVRLNAGKGAGVCNISEELLTYEREGVACELHAVLTSVWQFGAISIDWMSTSVVK